MFYDQLYVWMTRTGNDAFCGCRIDTLLGIYAAVRAGGGVAVLPAYLGDADSALEKLGNFIDDLAVDLWLLIHPDLRQTARVRCLLDFLAQSKTIRRLLRD
jgi:DNA-binding transcriptional LysR family regulator